MPTGIWFKITIGLSLAVLLLLGSTAMFKTKGDLYKMQRDTAQKEIKTLTDTVKSLNTSIENKDRIMNGYVTQLKDLNTKTVQTQNAIRKLGQQNATIQSYLDQPIPADLASLLNRPESTADQP